VTEQPQDTPLRSRVDAFEVIDVDCESVSTEEERSWPVVPLKIRLDGGELLEPTPAGGTEVVIRVRCDASATPTEVNAFVEKLRSAVEGVQASAANRFPVQIILPSPTG
jgi:hypothetical protein